MSLNERKRHKTATQRNHEAKKVVLDQCCNDLSLAIKKNGDRKPYGMVSGMVKDLEGVCP